MQYCAKIYFLNIVNLKVSKGNQRRRGLRQIICSLHLHHKTKKNNKHNHQQYDCMSRGNYKFGALHPSWSKKKNPRLIYLAKIQMILPRLKLSFSQADPTKMILSSLLLKQPKKQAQPNSLSLLDQWMNLEFLFFKRPEVKLEAYPKTKSKSKPKAQSVFFIYLFL